MTLKKHHRKLTIYYPPYYQPVPEDSTAFIEYLEGRVNWANLRVDWINNRVSNINIAKDDIRDHHTVVSNYWGRVQETDRLAGEVIATLTSAKSQAWRVCWNSSWTIKAIKSLVADMRELLDAVENLRNQIQELIGRIDALNDPELDRTRGVYKMLDEFKIMVNEAMAFTENAVTAVLEALEFGNTLDNNLGREADGIQNLLQDMMTHLSTGHKPGLEDPDLLPYEPIPSFPLADCDDDFHDRIQQEFKRVNSKWEHYERLTMKLEERKERIISRRDVFQNALDAAMESRNATA